ncbi:MAG: hypothetical protein JXR51_06530 [Bacteroidales bacterium]|nr:hypothetical protein [Bacteroidales bacterium]
MIFSLIFCFESKAQNKVILNEEFSNNDNNWTINSDPTHIFDINNHKYIIEGKEEQRAFITTISIENYSPNFIITTEFTKISGFDNNGYGIVFGSKDENNQFEFIVSGNGQFKIIEWNNGKAVELVPWSFSSSIDKWDLSKNLLSIENSDSLWKFFINNNYVARVNEKSFLGNKIGFIVNEKIKCEINFLKITSLDFIDNEVFIDANSIFKLPIFEVNFVGKHENKEILYGESAVLKLKIQNLNSFDLKDLVLNIIPVNSTDGLYFDDFVIIDRIEANQVKLISILIKTNDNVETANQKLNLNLYDVNNKLIGMQQIDFKIVGFYTYNEKTNKFSNQNQKSYKPKNLIRKSGQSCTRGCSYISLLVLLLGLLATII